jgi:hypothetical protein
MLRGDGATALDQVDRALRASLTLLENRPESPAAQLSAATSHLAVADLLADPRWPGMRDERQALQHYREARDLLESDAADPRVREAFVHAHGGMQALQAEMRIEAGTSR